jgi:membrane-associated phospholipid phosphatase
MSEVPVTASDTDTRNRTWMGVPVALVLCGILALAVDLPLSRFCVSGGLRWLHRFLEQVEPFGQPPGVVIICLALCLCGACGGRDAFRIAMSAIGAGLSADVLKLFWLRARPYHFFEVIEGDGRLTVFDTFRGWLPFFSGGSRLQGCPSAHTAFVTGFCVALCRFFPRGRPVFIVVASLVALQRIEGGAHFLSDTLWGGALGYGISHLWLAATQRGGLRSIA